MDTYLAKLGNIKTMVKNTPAELTVGEVANTETDVYARNHITSTTTIADKQTLNFTAGQSITLSPGFEAKQGSNATLKIGDVPATTSKEGEEVAGVFLKEHHIYGSSRLGILAHDKLIIAEKPEATNEPTGKKNYELTNHLGNVLSVISDERNGNKPDVIAFNDYYPGGMLLPGRHWNSNSYRYGYNGMEKDDELKGLGNSYTTHFRQYDSRIARWLTTDPKAELMPWQSPYVAMDNNPVMYNDPLGDCPTCPSPDKSSKGDNFTDANGVEYSFDGDLWKIKDIGITHDDAKEIFDNFAKKIPSLLHSMSDELDKSGNQLKFSLKLKQGLFATANTSGTLAIERKEGVKGLKVGGVTIAGLSHSSILAYNIKTKTLSMSSKLEGDFLGWNHRTIVSTSNSDIIDTDLDIAIKWGISKYSITYRLDLDKFQAPPDAYGGHGLGISGTARRAAIGNINKLNSIELERQFPVRNTGVVPRQRSESSFTLPSLSEYWESIKAQTRDVMPTGGPFYPLR